MTTLGLMSYRLAQACRGRENHSDLVSIRAVRVRNQRIRLEWEDAYTGQRGFLGFLTRHEASELLRTLFFELRAWRARCEGKPPLGERLLAKAAGGGR